MKALKWMLMAVCLVACGKKKELGGVNVGNGRHGTETYASALGFQFQYEARLRLSVSSDEKVVEVDNSPLMEGAPDSSRARLEVFEFGVDQRLFDSRRTLRENLPALQAEAERRYPNVRFSEVRRPGAVGVHGEAGEGGGQRNLYAFATVNYDLIVVEITARSNQPGAGALSAVAETLRGVRREVQVRGIHLNGGLYAPEDTLTLDMELLDKQPVEGEQLRACFWFNNPAWPQDSKPIVSCVNLSKTMAGLFQALVPVAELYAGQLFSRYDLVQVSIESERNELVKLIATRDREALVPAPAYERLWGAYRLPGIKVAVLKRPIHVQIGSREIRIR